MDAEIFCRLWLSTDIFISFATSSGYNLLFLSIERYLAITRPLTYDEQRIKSKLYILIPAIWISGFVLVLPDPFLFKVEDGMCLYTAGTLSRKIILLIYIYYIFNGFIFLGCTMLFLYAHMGIVIWRSQKLQKQITSKSTTKNDTLGKAQTNIFFTCVVLLVLFMTCWAVNQLNTMLYVGGAIPFSRTMFDISSLLIVFNSVVNPFIYTIRYEEFQHHLKLLIFGKKI